jgi:hypothetical protein
MSIRTQFDEFLGNGWNESYRRSAVYGDISLNNVAYATSTLGFPKTGFADHTVILLIATRQPTMA